MHFKLFALLLFLKDMHGSSIYRNFYSLSSKVNYEWHISKIWLIQMRELYALWGDKISDIPRFLSWSLLPSLTAKSFISPWCNKEASCLFLLTNEKVAVLMCRNRAFYSKYRNIGRQSGWELIKGRQIAVKILPLLLSLVSRGNHTAVTQKIHPCHITPTRL